MKASVVDRILSRCGSDMRRENVDITKRIDQAIRAETARYHQITGFMESVKDLVDYLGRLQLIIKANETYGIYRREWDAMLERVEPLLYRIEGLDPELSFPDQVRAHLKNLKDSLRGIS